MVSGLWSWRVVAAIWSTNCGRKSWNPCWEEENKSHLTNCPTFGESLIKFLRVSMQTYHHESGILTFERWFQMDLILVLNSHDDGFYNAQPSSKMQHKMLATNKVTKKCVTNNVIETGKKLWAKKEKCKSCKTLSTHQSFITCIESDASSRSCSLALSWFILLTSSRHQTCFISLCHIFYDFVIASRNSRL